MSTQHPSRRTLLKTLSLAGASGLALSCRSSDPPAEPVPTPDPGNGSDPEPSTDPGPSTEPDPGPEPTPNEEEYVCGEGPTVTRRNVTDLAPDDPILEAYREAVAKMKALPDSDPESWRAQALIHQDHCPHGNWYFLPWHRAYLTYFERVVREQSGMKDWALPYWNWTEDPQIPAPFWSGVLLEPSRTATPTSTANDAFVGPTVIADILSIPTFPDFASFPSTTQRGSGGYGELEGTPHNYIHGFVGGVMGTFMSPLDPIFWLHHCNVDRLWVEWIEAGHANTGDTAWSDFVFPQNFWDPCTDALVDVQVASQESTTALGYRYDTQAAAAPRSLGRPLPEAVELYRATVGADAAVGRPVSVALERGTTNERGGGGLSRALEQDAPAALRLGLEAIEPPRETIGVHVFLNCDYLDPSTPLNDPHYAGSVTFFEHGGDHAGMAEAGETRTFYLEVGGTLRALRRIRGYDPTRDGVSVQLLPVRLGDAGTRGTAKVRPERITLAEVRL